MNFAIWGAGGIGCYYGAKLQKAGHRVTFIARGDHLTALQERGLSVSHPEFDFNDAVLAVGEDQWCQQYHCDQFDLIIICLKSNETAPALGRLSSWLGSGSCPLLSLQNGVDNEHEMARIVDPRRILGGLAVRIGAHVDAPGEVSATGVAQVVFGPWAIESNERLQAFSETLLQEFKSAQIDTTLSHNIRHDLWCKLLINVGVNPISVLTQLDSKKIMRHPIYSQLVYQIMQETAKAACYDEVEVTESDVEKMYELIRNFDAIKTSMLVDFEKGRPIERDALCGAVLSRCEKLGVDAPTTKWVDNLLARKIDQQKVL